MPLDWTTGELMRPAGCLPCCNVSLGCYLTMPTALIDGNTTNYTNINVATAALSAQAIACYGETDENYSGTLTGAYSNTLDFAANDTTEMFGRVAVRFQVTAAETVSTNYVVTSDAGTYDIQMGVYEDDGVTSVGVNSVGNPTTGTISINVPSANYYYLLLSWSNARGTGGTYITANTSTDSPTFTPCGVRAAYDDGGGTSYVVCV